MKKTDPHQKLSSKILLETATMAPRMPRINQRRE